MAMFLDRVGAESAPARRAWHPRDCALYALALGASWEQLDFVSEGPTQRVYPSFVLSGVMAAEAESWPDPGFATGDYAPHELVQGEQALVLHRAIAASGDVETRTRVAGIFDKGTSALLVLEIHATDAHNREPVFTATTSLFVKGHGGFGGERGPRAPRSDPPARSADHLITYPTRAEQSLLWRHAGNDPNAIHVDPEVARRAGFRAPILSGLNTLGFACRALVECACAGEPARLRSLRARFAKPGYNGDSLTTEIWLGSDLGRDKDGAAIALFRVVNQDGIALIEQGRATLA